MPVVLDNDVGHRVLLYGADGSTLRGVVVDSSGRLVVVGPGASGALTVSATDLPLPSGAATAARQDTEITALQLIDDLRNALASVATDSLIVNARVYDGTSWQNLLGTAAGLLRQTKHFTAVVSQTYSGAPGAHAQTIRWTYTVPAGRIAYLEGTFIQLNGTDTNTNDFAVIAITRSGGSAVELLIWRRLTAAYQVDFRAWDIALAAGDSVTGQTSDSSGTTDFRVNAFFREITL